MKKTLNYLRNFCCFFVVYVFLGITSLTAQTNPTYYYVAPGGDDLNPGTELLPWKTFAKATSMATAGVTVFIRQGTYKEQLILNQSGTADKPVTFASFPGETATIDGTGLNLSSGVIDLTNLNNIRLTGLKVKNSIARGIDIQMCNNITIEKNIVDSTYGSGINSGICENIVIEANEIIRGAIGIEEGLTVGLSNLFEVKNNVVHDGPKEGIDVKVGSSNGIIHNNEVYNQKSTGFYIDAWDRPEFNIEIFNNFSHDNIQGISLGAEYGGLLNKIKLYNNVFCHNESRGIWVEGIGDTGKTHDLKNIRIFSNSLYYNWDGIDIGGFKGTNMDSIEIFNNLIYRNRSTGVSTGRYDQPSGEYRINNVWIINNTIHENGTTSNGWADGGINITALIIPENILIKNNIISNNAAFTICVQRDVPADSIIIDNNFFDGFRNFFFTETAGTNSVYGITSFVDTFKNDYHLQDTSACIDKGDSMQQYNDPEDPNKPGYALFPSKGTLRNDMGAYGGPYASSWDSTVSVAVPLVPSLASPSNNATSVPHTLLICWNGPWGATLYRVQISNSSDFSSLVIDQDSIIGSSYGIRNLANNTLYYWRVNATNKAGTSSYSSTWNFKTSDSALTQLSPEIPIISDLFQNYPNPFDQFTTIEFSITEESPVKLTILNSLGIEVEVLVNKTLSPGQYRTKWIPRNNAGGDYFCKLQIAEFISTKKLLLLK